jgi:hypothetical protein
MNPRSPFLTVSCVALGMQQTLLKEFYPDGCGVLGPSYALYIAGVSSRDIFLGKMI